MNYILISFKILLFENESSPAAVVQFPRKGGLWQSVHCWHRQHSSVTPLGGTAKGPELLICLSGLKWFSSPNLVTVPLNVCLMS